MGRKDVTEKLLEAYDDVFADIVNVLLFNGQRLVQPDELQDHHTRSAYKADGRIREIERDVAKTWMKNNVRIACIGFENQTEPDPYMPVRVFGYDGADYRDQLNHLKKGQSCSPVVTLVLYFGLRRWKGPRTLHQALQIPPELKPYVANTKMNLFEVAWLSREQVNMFQSDFKVVADYFVQMRKNDEYQPAPEKIRHVQEVLQLLSVMTRDDRFEEVMQEGQVKQCIYKRSIGTHKTKRH